MVGTVGRLFQVQTHMVSMVSPDLSLVVHPNVPRHITYIWKGYIRTGGYIWTYIWKGYIQTKGYIWTKGNDIIQLYLPLLLNRNLSSAFSYTRAWCIPPPQEYSFPPEAPHQFPLHQFPTVPARPYLRRRRGCTPRGQGRTI